MHLVFHFCTGRAAACLESWESGTAALSGTVVLTNGGVRGELSGFLFGRARDTGAEAEDINWFVYVGDGDIEPEILGADEDVTGFFPAEFRGLRLGAGVPRRLETEECSSFLALATGVAGQRVLRSCSDCNCARLTMGTPFGRLG